LGSPHHVGCPLRHRSFIPDEGRIGQEWRGIFPLQVIYGFFPALSTWFLMVTGITERRLTVFMAGNDSHLSMAVVRALKSMFLRPPWWCWSRLPLVGMVVLASWCFSYRAVCGGGSCSTGRIRNIGLVPNQGNVCVVIRHVPFDLISLNMRHFLILIHAGTLSFLDLSEKKNRARFHFYYVASCTSYCYM
jgi:hypothetical protein